MPTLALNLTLPPKDAVEFFDAKGNALTWSWLDMLREDHDLAFTVAKATNEEVLGAIRTQVAKAINEGMTFQQFKRTLKPTLQDLGWWGRQEVLDGDTGELTTVQLGSDRRLRTIYSTNIQTAYMAGRYKRMVSNAVDRPFWKYVAIMDGRTRPKHRELNGKVFRWDDPIWRVIYPPNGFGCRCRVVAMTEDEFKASGIKLSNSDGILITKEVVLRDGKSVKVTGLKGVLPGGEDFFPDVGWDYNPGDYRAAEERLASLTDQKALMAKRAQKAAQAAVDKLPPKPAPIPAPEPFDISTPAGKWHKPAWDGAPKWLRDVVVREQAVAVQARSKTAWARGGELIDTDGRSLDSRGLTTWRHEMGHILDYRLGGGGRYASSSKPFTQASAADAAAILQAKAARPQLAEITSLPASAWQTLSQDDFMAIIMRASGASLDVNPAQWPANVQQINRWMQHALDTRDAELFVAALMSAGSNDAVYYSLADLVGSATLNKACNPLKHFPGHSDKYYAKAAFYSYTEAFANLTALAGHSLPAWWTITQRLFPNLTAIYEQLIKAS